LSKEHAKALIASETLKPAQIVGVYFTTHKENIEWCWSVIAAGGIPVILSPLSNDPVTLKGQLGNLAKVFENPTVLTSKRVKPAFGEGEGLNLVAVEQIPRPKTIEDITLRPAVHRDELAILLLTSGSTGHSKAVRYSHFQLIASVRAKSAFHKIGQNTNFMSWICK
jgi:acyl-CoA synthetase (AMP-forming)/AMP-acid ligase II